MKSKTPYHFLNSLLILSLLSMAVVACKTQQTVTPKGSRYVINTGEEDNSDEIEAQFGTSYAEAFGEESDGSGAKRSKLESKMFSGAGDTDLTSKEFRGVKDFGESKEFRTPEYLKRHELNTPDAREAGKKSRDGQSVFRESDRTFRGADELTFWQKLNPFRSRATPAREADKMFRAKDYKRGNKAVSGSLVPEPMGSFGDGIGDYRDNAMSMDDVKRLVSPETYKKR